SASLLTPCFVHTPSAHPPHPHSFPTRRSSDLSWRHKTQTDKEQNPLWYEHSDELISPQWFIEQVYEATGGKAIVTTDVGQHQMWSAQFYKFNQPNHFVTSGGLGTMGFGLPAAIGAQLAFPDNTVVAVVADGGFQMTMQ